MTQRRITMDAYDEFIVEPGTKVDLSQIDPNYTGDLKKKKGKALLRTQSQKINKQQSKLAAGKQHSLLIILQGMDTGGKDGTMDTLLASMKAKHCRSHYFQKPTKSEMAYNFLWRAQNRLPAKGRVAIWHRSPYEETLVTRVEDLYPPEKIEARYKHLNDFEDLLTEDHTVVLKFFLYMSPEEQWKRLQKRAEEKQWKVTKNDFEARLKWEEYQQAYERMMEKTSTERAPWFIIPADNKWFRDYAVTQIVTRCLKDLNLEYPGPSEEFNEVAEKFLRSLTTENAAATNDNEQDEKINAAQMVFNFEP